MIRMQLSEAAQIMHGACRGGNPEFAGCTLDTRQLAGGELFIAMQGRHADGHDFVDLAHRGGAVAAMVERDPGAVTLPWLQVDSAHAAMGRLAAAWRARFDVPIVAITGSNGKSTVKEMLACILGPEALVTHGNYNNELGVPLTLFRLGSGHHYGVLEMGAAAPGDIAYLTDLVVPQVAVVTQCAPAHLQGFGSLAAVARAKAEIYQGLAADGIAVINADDAYAALWQQLASGHTQLSFGMTARADCSATYIQQDAAGLRLRLRLPDGEREVLLALPGRHQLMNALAAAACAHALAVDIDTIAAGLARCTTLPGRLALREGINGCRVLDDSYNANPGSLDAALALLCTYPGRRWLVLGDMRELGATAEALHRAAGERTAARGVERLWSLGALAGHAAQAAAGRAYMEVESLITDLQSQLQPGDTILVKGSRAMAMERIVTAILARPGEH